MKSKKFCENEMELPRRIRTQFATKENIAKEESLPVPIETAFFLEDAKQDLTKMNRFYFNFPAEWCTSNKGESVIGVRSMWLLARRRKLEVTIKIAKIDKKTYESKLHGNVNDQTVPVMNWKSLEGYGHCIQFKVIDWVSVDGDLRGFFDAVNDAFRSVLLKDDTLTIWTQDDDDIASRDIQTDGYYDSKGFHEIIYAEKNKNNNTFIDIDKTERYEEPYMVFFRLIDYNDDFKEVFNIGTEPDENDPEQYKIYSKQFIFDHIWDRHSCKVYSSIGEQSLHHYIGNSQIDFCPIKYYKLNSTDQQFWIELYSGRNYNVPIKLPKNESFVIEMQLLPFQKMLYV